MLNKLLFEYASLLREVRNNPRLMLTGERTSEECGRLVTKVQKVEQKLFNLARNQINGLDLITAFFKASQVKACDRCSFSSESRSKRHPECVEIMKTYAQTQQKLLEYIESLKKETKKPFKSK